MPDQFSDVSSYIRLPSFWTVLDGIQCGLRRQSSNGCVSDGVHVERDRLRIGPMRQLGAELRGVANMEIRNAELEVLGTVLAVSLIKTYAKVPHCFLSLNQLRDYPTMLNVYSNVTEIQFLSFVMSTTQSSRGTKSSTLSIPGLPYCVLARWHGLLEIG